MKPLVFLSALLFIVVTAAAQPQQTEDPAVAYTRVLTQRAAKIVTPLNIADSVKAQKVQSIIVQQYRDLNEAHDSRKATIKALKEKAGEGNKPDSNAVKAINAATEKQLKQLHDAYLSKLSALLNTEQVNQVKDGMTYGVFNVTYTAYTDMIPTLTDGQKSKIHTWLTEARELIGRAHV